MAVKPISYDATGGVTVQHEEANHGGTLAFADVRFGRNVDGSIDSDVLLLTCPVCGSASSHPVSGGAAPGMVQKLFLRTVLRRAAILGVPVGQRTFAGVKARLKTRILQMEQDPARWRLEGMTTEDDPVES